MAFKEYYITYEQSKLLTEKCSTKLGEDYYNWYGGWDRYGLETNVFSTINKLEYPKVPLHVVQNWFRDNKNIHIEPSCVAKFNQQLEVIGYYYECTIKYIDLNKKTSMSEIPERNFDTYEEALSAGIDVAIKHIH